MPRHQIKLVAFDMEGCLTDDPTVWEIMHGKLGTWESHGQPYWDDYRAGKFDYDTFARMDVAVWRDAPLDVLREASAEVALMRGCRETLAALKGAGVAAAIITNGLSILADRFRREFGVEHIQANNVVATGGRLTGEIALNVPYDRKGEAVRRLAAELGLSCDQTATVGDSQSDIAMFREARIGVAFCPCHQSVADAATHVVRDRDLGAVADIVLAG